MDLVYIVDKRTYRTALFDLEKVMKTCGHGEFVYDIARDCWTTGTATFEKYQRQYIAEHR